MTERTQRAEELYDKHRDKVWKDIESGTENFDKYMLTFSSGAFVLSLGFIKDVVPLKSAVWIVSLILSWVSFVLCIVVTLFSFRCSIKAMEETIPALGEYYLKGNEEAFNSHLKSKWSKAVSCCTVGQITFFLFGVLCTLAFVIANVREERMSKPQNVQKIATADFGKGRNLVAMTPLPAGAHVGDFGENVVPMTPIVTATEDRGLKPVPVTPIPTLPTQPLQPPQSPQK